MRVIRFNGYRPPVPAKVKGRVFSTGILVVPARPSVAPANNVRLARLLWHQSGGEIKLCQVKDGPRQLWPCGCSEEVSPLRCHRQTLGVSQIRNVRRDSRRWSILYHGHGTPG